MKKNIFKNVAVILFTLGILFAIGVQADTWNEPSSDAPSGSLPVPIHEGFDQAKTAGLSVNKFIAYQSAFFAQSAYLSGVIRGGAATDTNSTVHFGGLATNGTNYNVSIEQNGKMSVVGKITDSGLTTALAAAPTNHLCADNSGKIVTCDDSSGGGGGCSEGTTNAWPDGQCHPTIDISSPYPGMKISDLTGIVGFIYDKTKIVGSTSEGYELRQQGIHDKSLSSTTLKVTIAGPIIAGGPFDKGNLTIEKSGYEVKCIEISKNAPATTYSIPMNAYDTTDVISITGNLGGC